MTPFNSTGLYDGPADVTDEQAAAAVRKVTALNLDNDETLELLRMLGLVR